MDSLALLKRHVALQKRHLAPLKHSAGSYLVPYRLVPTSHHKHCGISYLCCCGYLVVQVSSATLEPQCPHTDPAHLRRTAAWLSASGSEVGRRRRWRRVGADCYHGNPAIHSPAATPRVGIDRSAILECISTMVVACMQLLQNPGMECQWRRGVGVDVYLCVGRYVCEWVPCSRWVQV